MKSINPATLEVILETTELSDAELEAKLFAAHKAYLVWRTTTFAERALLMKKAAAHLRGKKDTYAAIMTAEVGKTLAAASAEVEKCALVCEYYANNAEKFLTPEIVVSDAAESFVRFDPLGVVLAVMPWNFPLWQVFRFAAPALMAGNTGVLKHASNVQGSARSIEEVFRAAGFPEGVFLNLAIGASKVERVIQDARVVAVTLTGSEYAGSQVAMQAGKEIKKTVLELGGSDPFIVLADADVDQAAKVALVARLQANVGQSCISAKRFIVAEEIVEEFTKKLKTLIEALKVGDPTDSSTDVGPMVNEQVRTDVEKQVQASLEMGAMLITGGTRLDRTGYFYTPALLVNVTSAMPVFSEEVFGPVLPVVAFSSIDGAIALANRSPYGLGASIFTKDIELAKQLAAQIESGAVFINSHVKSDPRLPFGGIKKSGYGRELSSYGIREFVNVKTVFIAR